MKNFAKFAASIVSLGGKAVELCSKVTETVDHVIHRREYEKAKKHARVFRIMLGVAGGILAVLFFPYKIIIEKNGDFEIRSLLMKVSSRTQPYNLPDSGDGEFDICGVEDDATCQVVEPTSEEE